MGPQPGPAPLEMSPYAEAWRHRRQRRAERLEDLRARVTAALPGLAEALATAGVRRAWLFGSWAWGRPHERSDVDLAVEGCPPGGAIDLGRHLERRLADMGCDMELDVRRIEDLPHVLRERIGMSGVPVHAGP